MCIRDSLIIVIVGHPNLLHFPPLRRNYCLWTRKWLFCSLLQENDGAPGLLFSCCKSFGLLHTAQILVFKFNFAINRASPWVKLMTLDLRSLVLLFIWLWPMKYGHWETTSRKKCLLHPKNITFYNFRRTDFPKAPFCAFKNTPFTCLSPLFASCASAR